MTINPQNPEQMAKSELTQIFKGVKPVNIGKFQKPGRADLLISAFSMVKPEGSIDRDAQDRLRAGEIKSAFENALTAPRGVSDLTEPNNKNFFLNTGQLIFGGTGEKWSIWLSAVKSDSGKDEFLPVGEFIIRIALEDDTTRNVIAESEWDTAYAAKEAKREKYISALVDHVVKNSKDVSMWL